MSYGLTDLHDEGHAEDFGVSGGLELWSQLQVDSRPDYRMIWGLWKHQTRAQIL